MRFCYPNDTELSWEKSMSREWLETNGLGSYASSTITNCHTRKYHGLLVSKLQGLPDKYLLLNKIEDVLVHDGSENFLTAHEYPNCLQTGSFAELLDFKLTTHPCWNFKFTHLNLTKEILLPYKENTVLIKYTVTGRANFKIILRPLLAYRNFHQLQHENSCWQQQLEQLTDGVCCMPYPGMPKMYFQTAIKHRFLAQPLWYHNFIYAEEKTRGYDFQEDLFSPGAIIIESNGSCEFIVACGITHQVDDLTVKWQQEIVRRTKNMVYGTADSFRGQLQQVAQTFITRKIEEQQSQAIVAGYHWFLEWGRDAMISLPGLTLYSGQEEVCIAILKNFASQEDKGLIPNFLGATKETNAYNTVDASLWFVWAVQQYYLKTNDLETLATSFWQILKNIFACYKNGTLYNIKMQENSLLYAGSPEINLTWMDAMVDGKPVTARYGYQVEVNALWFNLLGFMEELAGKLRDTMQDELRRLLQVAKDSFGKIFWCEEKGYLYDYVNSEEKSSALRPNQIFAVSLGYSPLSILMAAKVVQVVKEQLLTPYGLRTLAKDARGYVGCYQGNQRERDVAYHNGTVWPWLLGHFTEAFLKVTLDRQQVLDAIAPCLEALRNHLAEYGIGSIAEIFSGDLPHHPNGCISQAWSVAEVLRLTYLLDINK